MSFCTTFSSALKSQQLGFDTPSHVAARLGLNKQMNEEMSKEVLPQEWI